MKRPWKASSLFRYLGFGLHFSQKLGDTSLWNLNCCKTVAFFVLQWIEEKARHRIRKFHSCRRPSSQNKRRYSQQYLFWVSDFYYRGQACSGKLLFINSICDSRWKVNYCVTLCTYFLLCIFVYIFKKSKSALASQWFHCHQVSSYLC